ncbi:hypothetical protein [Streptomyces cyaneochromogenes]|uniref:hypothetical protein n=1 Tax=Streptomyces cyaneochromogenes TaxID=2496836 RepID=UPI00225E3FDB|nr:hypothetical protein [Streptomyces cyaneochromogenes]
MPEIADTWLCIWGKGYATEGLAEFLCGLDGLPVAAWTTSTPTASASSATSPTALGGPSHPSR